VLRVKTFESVDGARKIEVIEMDIRIAHNRVKVEWIAVRAASPRRDVGEKKDKSYSSS
jgi:hypothetical protein